MADITTEINNKKRQIEAEETTIADLQTDIINSQRQIRVLSQELCILLARKEMENSTLFEEIRNKKSKS